MNIQRADHALVVIDHQQGVNLVLLHQLRRFGRQLVRADGFGPACHQFGDGGATQVHAHVVQRAAQVTVGEHAQKAVVRIHHGDPDSYARAYNAGWDDALRDAIKDIPEGNNDGWTRYDTDDQHVLSVYENGETWDSYATKAQAASPHYHADGPWGTDEACWESHEAASPGEGEHR